MIKMVSKKTNAKSGRATGNPFESCKVLVLRTSLGFKDGSPPCVLTAISGEKVFQISNLNICHFLRLLTYEVDNFGQYHKMPLSKLIFFCDVFMPVDE